MNSLYSPIPEKANDVVERPPRARAKDEAAERVSNRIDALFEQTRLACEVRDPELIESLLRELVILNDIRSYLADPNNSREPLRAIVEFLDGDVDRPPYVFPMAGSLEADNKICREIERRWSGQ